VQSRYLGFERPEYLSGLTPLQRAAQQADLAAMVVLLNGGADPSLPSRTPVGDTPLLRAVRSVSGVPSSALGNRPGRLAYRPRTPGDSLDAVRLLLDGKADVNGTNWDGSTPLHVAAQLGANDIIQLLAERGARLDAKNDDGQTALDLVTASMDRSGRGGGSRRGGGNANPEATVALLRQLMGRP
jgi:ankyrin repeat protein